MDHVKRNCPLHSLNSNIHRFWKWQRFQTPLNLRIRHIFQWHHLESNIFHPTNHTFSQDWVSLGEHSYPSSSQGFCKRRMLQQKDDFLYLVAILFYNSRFRNTSIVKTRLRFLYLPSADQLPKSKVHKISD